MIRSTQRLRLSVLLLKTNLSVSVGMLDPYRVTHRFFSLRAMAPAHFTVDLMANEQRIGPENR